MHHIACLLPLLTLLLVGCDSSPQPPTTAATLERRSNPSADAVTSGAVKWRSNRHGPAQPVSPSAETTAPDTAPRTLEWDDLMPADFDPGASFQNIDTANLADDDPRAQEMLAKLRQLWDEAPVVTALDGAQIRLPGFAVPLETDGEIATRFLLVPYIGACIHVPPPPLNQTVLVEAPKGARIRHVFDPVWVTGQLTVRRAATELANAGYTLTATDVKPYGGKQR